MSWASARRLTRVEDQAYCLLGIFDVHMPLLYGERHAAFRRLQEEIIKRSSDQSIFAWQLPAKAFAADVGWRSTSIFASSPSYFATSGATLTDTGGHRLLTGQEVLPETWPYNLTNTGLQFRCQSREVSSRPAYTSNALDKHHIYAVRLNCIYKAQGEDARPVSIMLHRAPTASIGRGTLVHRLHILTSVPTTPLEIGSIEHRTFFVSAFDN